MHYLEYDDGFDIKKKVTKLKLSKTLKHFFFYNYYAVSNEDKSCIIS